jgi:AcrR family transcriptional regulator
MTLRERILESAQEIHSAEGLEALTMRRVASALEVSATAIYRHYRDKDDLLHAIAAAGFVRLAELMSRPHRRLDPLAECHRLFMVYLEFALGQPRLYEVMFLLERRQAGRFPDDFGAQRVASFAVVRRQVEVTMRAGALAADDPLEVALTMWAHAHGLVTLFNAGRFTDERQFRRIYRRSIDRLLRGLAVPHPEEVVHGNVADEGGVSRCVRRRAGRGGGARPGSPPRARRP